MSRGLDGPKINQAVKTDIENSVLCWLATVDPAGVPNVTPKQIFYYYGDDHLIVADIASAHSVRNIHSHPTVCVSFIDVFRQRGFKIVGLARVIAPEDDTFRLVGADLLRMAGDAFPIRHIILIKIQRISRIWAPSYTLFPDQTEEDRMQSAYDSYGVVRIRASDRLSRNPTDGAA